MTGTIDITCTVPAPTLTQVRAWLTREGWTEHQDGRSIWPAPRWTPPGPPSHALYIYDIADTVHNIARITSRTPEAVYREIVGPIHAEAKLEAIGNLLAENGCDCDCDHHREEHDDDCERCLACRVSAVVGPMP